MRRDHVLIQGLSGFLAEKIWVTEAEVWDEQPQVTGGVVSRSGILLGSKLSKLGNSKVAG